MFLDKIFPQGKKERLVIENIRQHLSLLLSACEVFKSAMEAEDKKLMRQIRKLEREGDSVRREIISQIYQGAFLPYIRPDFCRFVEIVDEVFDMIEDAAFNFIEARIPDSINIESRRVAFLNIKICEMLVLTFEAMLKGENLREKSLAIRIYEKKIDDLKYNLLKDLRCQEVENFWEGKILSDFIHFLTLISNGIEDASDHLQIINASMK